MIRSTFEKKLRRGLKIAQVPIKQGLKLAYARMKQLQASGVKVIRNDDLVHAACGQDAAKYYILVRHFSKEFMSEPVEFSAPNVSKS